MTNSRREFFRVLFGFFITKHFLLAPFSSMVRLAYGKAAKVILPKGTKTESLISRNPSNLDTRNLEITPLKDFGTMGLTDYKADTDLWRLKMDGHVRRSLMLKYEDILALPSIEKDVLMICPGVFVNHGRWKGLSMDALLNRAEAETGSTHMTFRGPEGDYEKTQQFPLEDVLSNKVFLAYQVNGKMLPNKHGFPLRIVAEGYYGHDWVKFVCRVTVDKIKEK